MIVDKTVYSIGDLEDKNISEILIVNCYEIWKTITFFIKLKSGFYLAPCKSFHKCIYLYTSEFSKFNKIHTFNSIKKLIKLENINFIVIDDIVKYKNYIMQTIKIN